MIKVAGDNRCCSSGIPGDIRWLPRQAYKITLCVAGPDNQLKCSREWYALLGIQIDKTGGSLEWLNMMVVLYIKLPGCLPFRLPWVPN